jgi:hypothetical protein
MSFGLAGTDVFTLNGRSSGSYRWSLRNPSRTEFA